jgi:hypothetical protein
MGCDLPGNPRFKDKWTRRTRQTAAAVLLFFPTPLMRALANRTAARAGFLSLDAICCSALGDVASRLLRDFGEQAICLGGARLIGGNVSL